MREMTLGRTRPLHINVSMHDQVFTDALAGKISHQNKQRGRYVLKLPGSPKH